ncbi:MAG: PHP domain-containing protein [Actinobacteria bacterium]|nr:PHP domain-containing protein [Actinomycetota bacterium]MBI3687800.1 PHP domain-containing protein [Actinomycetota bacterium]
MRIDLHAHSTASDGTDTPAALVWQAGECGLDVIGLTDHDTTGGWTAAVDALPAGLTLVRGAELSCVSAGPSGPVTLHLLAYLFDPDDPAFVAERSRLRASRRDRGREIVERLAADGFPIDWPTVAGIADGGAVGRPHIARALVSAGVAGSVAEAFDRLLHQDGPYYLAKADIEVLGAVRLVRRAGGVPVFAHPLARRRGAVVDDEVIAAMAAAGLAGLEVDHTDHSAADRAHLRGLAGELGLLVTGASDYHGTNKPVRLGERTTDPEVYEAIVAAATGAAPVTA